MLFELVIILIKVKVVHKIHFEIPTKCPQSLTSILNINYYVIKVSFMKISLQASLLTPFDSGTKNILATLLTGSETMYKVE